MTKPQATGEIAPELEGKCDGDNQFQRFDDLCRKVISVPKSAEAREKRRKTRKKKRAA